MKGSFYILLLCLTQQVISQELIRKDLSNEDPYYFYVNDNDSTQLFYYKMVPPKPIGVLTILPSGGESIESLLQQIDLHKVAYQNNLLVVIPSINWGTIQRTPDMAFLDTIFMEIVTEHQVSKDHFILCGLSNGGMISLTYGIRSVRDQNTYLKPKGIIGLDPPLDFARFYNYCEREVTRDFTPAGVAESQWFLNVYNQVYGGSPDSVPQNYVQASIFSYGAPQGGNAQYLNDISILMYTELNLDYLINQRHRDLYDWNGIDIVAFINQLKLNGNPNAEVIVTRDKGVKLDGTKHPHSWSIMDTDKTIQWILELLEG